MQMQENVPVGSKTTMRIGGNARYFAELLTKDDVEQAVVVAEEKGMPLFVLGSGANTVFADGTIEALVVRLKNDQVTYEGNTLTVGSGKNLAMLINECAEKGLDLSPLTGIPGTLGGSIFGNAGQGPKGIWIDHFVRDVTAFVESEWRTFSKDQCGFVYRGSAFKEMHQPIIWEATLELPSADPATIKATIQSLLKKRIETQPHLKTAGSCFKAVDGTPAWQLIDAASLRGHKVGEAEIAQKHANFLLNTGQATYADTKKLVLDVMHKVPHALDVEMRFVEGDGKVAF